ncbi:MAG: putative transrane protein [Labilithrix sp.]|nr:putative transrane protein [Labilithrix sp.]
MFAGYVGPHAERRHRFVAGYLACAAGFANSAGYVLIGTFSSHVTGNVGRLASDLAQHHALAGLSAFALLLSFFAGAFLVSTLVESRALGRPSRGYVVALSLEALLLLAFTLLTSSRLGVHPRILDAQASFLCAAMGMQNGLITHLSGAVVRTTHLTGVVTDLGIEAARWFRYWRHSVSSRAHVKLVIGRNVTARPAVPKVLLLLTIAASFTVGAVLGAFAAHGVGRPAMAVPVVAIALCAFYAHYTGREGRYE